MIKVITYGTYDLLHEGHIRLLKRAKALGDYLIVGVTAEDFDKTRGKINVQQSLMERVEAVRATGVADEIIIEEYEGQKIDDVQRYDIDIFTVGSDWKGKFDYLKEYCQVIYLPRTEGISSSELRAEKRKMKIGIVGNAPYLDKFLRESEQVNGVEVSSVEDADAVYIVSAPELHAQKIAHFIEQGQHVLCEAPIALNADAAEKLFLAARNKGVVLMEGIKTAYSTAYSRLCLLTKTGILGEIRAVETTCTSLQEGSYKPDGWNALCAWGPTTMLPVFQLLGTGYVDKHITTWCAEDKWNDAFTKIDFIYPTAVASVKIGVGVKSEGDMIISGTKGYIYVPAPWWKTDYFEIRYENQANNKRYFYQLDGEGIRYEILAFVKAIETGGCFDRVGETVSAAIAKVIEDYKLGACVTYLHD